MSKGTLNKGSLVKGGGAVGGSPAGLVALGLFTNADWDLDVTGTQLNTHLTLGDKTLVFKNGVGPLHPTQDYTISGSTITFVTPLISTDRIEVLSFTNVIDLTAYQLKAETVTIAEASVTIAEIKANTNYKLTSNALTDITFSGCETSDEVTTIEFTTGENDVTFTDNSGIDWADGETPAFYAYQHYLIVIFNKIGFVKEVY